MRSLLRFLGIRTRFLLFCLLANVAGLVSLLPYMRSDDLKRVQLYIGGNVVVVGILAFVVAGSVTGPLSRLRHDVEEAGKRSPRAGFGEGGGHDEVTALRVALNEWAAGLPEGRGGSPVEEAPPEETTSLGGRAGAEAEGLSALLELSKVLHANYDFSRAASEILKRTNEILDLEWSSVCLLDSDRKELFLVASEGLDPDLTSDLRIGSQRKIQFEAGRGVSGEVIAKQEPLVINRGHRDKRFAHFKEFQEHHKRINSIACFPLRVPQPDEGEGRYEIMGLLNAVNIKSPPVFRPSDVEFLRSVAEILSVLLAKSSHYEDAFIDEITGLQQHGYWMYQLREEFERYKRKPFSIGLIRLDVNFHGAVDTSQRDELLRRIGDITRGDLRKVDFACRHAYSMLVALPDTDRLGTMFMAGRLKDHIDTLSMDPDTDEDFFTCDVGVAACPEGVEKPERLVSCAEQALALSRQAGDHRLVCYTDPSRAAGVATTRESDAEAM